jgi:hypothetical protein
MSIIDRIESGKLTAQVLKRVNEMTSVVQEAETVELIRLAKLGQAAEIEFDQHSRSWCCKGKYNEKKCNEGAGELEIICSKGMFCKLLNSNRKG